MFLGWQYSCDILTKLNQKLSKHFNNADLTIAIAWSFGRFDAGKPSDLDFYVVSDNVSANHQIHETVTKFAKGLELKLPGTEGIFSKVLDLNQIITKMGCNRETPDELAQRLLLLLETQPIYNMEFYEKAVNEILDKYYFDLHKKHPYKEAVILLNDLIKYFRYICMNYQFNFWNNNEKWVIRNIKLRHSRVIMYAGLLFVLLNASNYREEKTEYIKKMIKLTPIERINSVLTENDVDPSPLFECYDKYLYNINNEAVRASFNACPLEYTDRYNNPIFKELKINSDCLQTFLTNSVLDMRKNGSQKAFEYLIF